MQIAHIATLWSLTGYPSYKREWPLEKKIAAVAAAGFHGIIARLTPEHRRLAEKNGLTHLIGFISSSDPAEFARCIREQKEAGAVHINVQMDDHDTPPALAVKHWLAMERHAEKIGGVVMSLEVHRDICTETPEKTYEIAERYHRATGRLIRFTFDFSHLAVVKHLAPANYAERLLDHPALLQHSVQCHCRPFNGHHCQVPVTYRGKLSPEVKSYLPFVEKLFKLWKSAPANANRTFFVCPEMGCAHEDGSGYNISGLPPAWPDAIILRRELQRLWQKT
jgi:hypothetical protein